MKIEILEEAEYELNEAIAYYQAIEPRLGIRRKEEIRGAIKWIGNHPELPRIRPKGYRRVNLKVFGGVRQNSGAGSEISIKVQFCIYGSKYWPKIIAVRRQEGVVDHSNSHVGWAKAPADWTHSRTLARDRRRVGEGFGAGFRTAAGCQPAIQPITNRRYLAGAGGFLKFVSHPVFGYYIAYDIWAETIWILAIAHGRRRPEYWIERRKSIG